ncbi:DUF488 domain-containing protein [Bounagaea algeriensis]
MELLTFGHGTASEDEITALLHGAGVRSVLDVRSAPGSRRNPQFARGELQRWLPESGISYRWDKRLGGFRKLPNDSPDWVLRNDAFRAYAAHMRTREFTDGVDELLDELARTQVAVMCSESLWWRCHRRMISDFVQLVREVPVAHLTHRGERDEHEPIDGVRVNDDGCLVYDAGQSML